jgi:hypothetical protein
MSSSVTAGNQNVLHTHGTGGRSTGHFHGVNAQGGAAHNNMSPFTVVTYIIRT